MHRLKQDILGKVGFNLLSGGTFPLAATAPASLLLDVQSPTTLTVTGGTITTPSGSASSVTLETGIYLAWKEAAGWRVDSEAYSSRRRSRSLAWQTRFGASRVMGGVWPAGIMDFVDDVYFTGLDARAPGEMISRSGGIKNVISASGSLVTVPADALAFDHSSGQRRALFEGNATNGIRNNIGAGGTVGTPGTAPTNWSLFSNGGWGLSREVVGTGTENGIPYVDVRIYGTTTSAFSWQFIAAFETATSIAAAVGETWTASAFVKVVSGSGIDPRLIITERDSAGAYLGRSTSVSCNAGALTRFAETHTLANASTAYIHPGVQFTVANGATVDSVIRIGLPQAEKGPIATSVILTSGSAVTRSTDFSSWSALAVSTVSVTGCTMAVRGRVLNRSTYSEVLSTVSGGLTTLLVGVDTVAVGQVYALAPGSSWAMNLASTAIPLDLAVCIGWDGAGQISSISGSAPTTHSGGAVGPLTEIVIGSKTLGIRDGHAIELAEVVWWPVKGASADVQTQARAFQP